MAGGAETPNIAALPAIARLGSCESVRGPDADRHVKLLSQLAVEGSLSGSYSQLGQRVGCSHHGCSHQLDFLGRACILDFDADGFRKFFDCMTTTASRIELIDRIYECAFVPDLWPDALHGVAKVAEARGGLLFAININVGALH